MMIPVTEIPLQAPSGDVVAAVERQAALLGLQIHRGSLRKWPRCTHWHFTLPGSRGTLEATFVPPARLWLAVHDSRRADWQEAVIDRFRAAFS